MADVNAGTQPLTALTPIIPGQQDELRAVLAGLATRIGSGGPTPLDEIGTVHFARWVILPDVGEGGTLLFTSNFDGPWDDYIEDFAADAADSFNAIYRHCVDWPASGATDVAAFKEFVRKHEVPVDVYYRAYPETVAQVKTALLLKSSATTMLDMLNR